MGNEYKTEVAVFRIRPDGCCTYCHREFGSLVTWAGRNLFLGETSEHVLPKVLGGKIRTPACTLCNRIKGALRFDSLADIQDYCLDKLTTGRSVTLQYAWELKVGRAVRAEEITEKDVKQFQEEEVEKMDEERVLLQKEPKPPLWPNSTDREVLRWTRIIEAKMKHEEREYERRQLRGKMYSDGQRLLSRNRKEHPDAFSIETLPKPRTS